MKHIYLLLLVFATSISWGQEFALSGVVRDATLNEPLPGVNVIIKNTSRGTTTDFDGNFTVQNISTGDVLVFSSIGFLTREVTVQGTDPITVILQDDVSALDEVVVVGYGTQTKKEITGAVSVVGSETIEELNPTRVEQALQGQVAGVQVTSESGSPGAGSNIRIRGISTNGDNRPLILVDGNVIEDLSVINPGDIESINILKDATAGIYGVRAANGVVLITTKTGKRNSDLQFNYDAYAGFQETSRKIPVLNATEYALILNEAFTAGGDAAPFPNVSRLGEGTDWQDEVFQKAPIINHNLTINGGSEKSTYSFGSSFLTQNGIVGGPKSNFRRWTTRINFNTELFKDFKLTTNLLYTGTNRKTLPENALGSVLFNSLNNAPTFGIRDRDGNFTLAEGLGNEVINPLAQISNTYNENDVDRISGKIGGSYTFFNDFTVESNFQFNYAEVYSRFFAPEVFYGSGKVFNIDRNFVVEGKNLFRDFTWDNFINYEKTLSDDHNIKATLGMSVFKTTGLFSGSTGFDIPNNDFQQAFLTNASDVVDNFINTAGKFDSRLLSYFTRLQYNYKGKYLLSGIIRRDGSTNFGPRNRFGYFPSGSVGYIISEEQFLQDSDVLTFLKLRGSYGIVGNDRIGGNAFRSVLSGEGAYVLGGELLFGQAVGAISNPEIQWEEQKTLDIGVDMKLFNNRVDITADYFKKRTEDLLVSPPVSGILGAAAPGSGSPTVNAGTVENKGFEFAIGYNSDASKDFYYNINYNMTFLENEVISVNNGVGFIPGGSFGVGQDPPARMEDGKPLGYFYGLQTDGIFQNQAEVDAHATQANAAPGDLRFVDINGDGVIDSRDRTDIGNPIPDATMGLNLSLNYKAIDFTAYAFASVGNEIVRNYERNQPRVNRSVYTLNRWTGEGSTNSYPRMTTGATSNTLFSDFFVEDGSFVRLQNVQVGYTMPRKIVEDMGIRKLRFYLSASNVFTLTEYKGYDPSASSGAPIGAGIDQGFYPVPRTYLMGVNLKF
ncbi:SusC/RagA family TonB-linked outer membrane protein [Zeaxanthinibacter enoshimensis]|uniref:TonB-linked SusC/RagA family outer membrane protein n=1 Tax=Zeaxanthinibacter enoshimensis TaxID=392009 RepID=A0A4R6TG04_9FLAO|nr:TonB-dependent receptor [Zeaxanthinibacter enoshimensis]TDQ29137.1 TonB-linked SusC/RagA family outer membrane protein [Zeaxanthinibacter enoshimensis]